MNRCSAISIEVSDVIFILIRLVSVRCGCVQARLREEARASHFIPKGSEPPAASVRLQICIDTAPVRFVH